jgi:hypothetical protein
MYSQQASQAAQPQTSSQAAQPQTASSENQPSHRATEEGMVVLTDGTDVPLLFDEDISSKTSAEGDQVTFVLAEDLKAVVAKAGAKAQGEVTNAKKSGMMGKAGELNVRLNYK